jgi:hypothetical protein
MPISRVLFHCSWYTYRQTHDSDQSDHFLLDILISGLDLWFKGSTLSPTQYPLQYHHLIAEQPAIGWRHLFNGHMLLKWRTKQDYITSVIGKSKHSPMQAQDGLSAL